MSWDDNDPSLEYCNLCDDFYTPNLTSCSCPPKGVKPKPVDKPLKDIRKNFPKSKD